MKKETITIELLQEEHPKFGMMGKLTFENGSALYIFNDGWHLKHPDEEKGLTIPWCEIEAAVESSIKLGYVTDKDGNKIKIREPNFENFEGLFRVKEVAY